MDRKYSKCSSHLLRLIKNENIVELENKIERYNDNRVTMRAKTMENTLIYQSRVLTQSGSRRIPKNNSGKIVTGTGIQRFKQENIKLRPKSGSAT